MRIVTAPVLSALWLVLACGSTAQSPGPDTETGPGSSSGVVGSTSDGSSEGACIPGYEACACTPEGLCLMGLQCLSDLCVEMPAGDTSGAAESTGAAASTTGTDDTTTANDSSSSSSGGGESSSTGEPPPVCPDGDTFCAAGTENLSTCVDGQWVESTCTEHCAALAYDQGTCDDATQQGCICSEPNDADCSLGVAALCYCYEVYGSSCDQDMQDTFYATCVDDSDPSVACFGAHVIQGGIDCEMAIADCL